ncbi:MAG: bifunctional nicotinamidase/pyrazinamidase, partial [Alphaproteobacteria bacterium]|nr:bifunctional nicotinamidase/pyrazinamidase [Alphaproteobacteria bacterium]
MTFTAPKTTALIVVDVQNDFCPGGNLAVNEGDQIVSDINAMRGSFETRVYTKDWHPADHKSFASNHDGKNPFETIQMPYGVQVLWPDHCIQGTDGAAFHSALQYDGSDLILEKGTNPGIDSYSGFYENDQKTQPHFANGKTLTETLKARGIKQIVLCGLAYDFCVGWHALDARKEGFEVIVVKDAARSIAMPLPDGSDTEAAMDAQL